MIIELSKVINKLESGSRPKGGVKGSIAGIPSLGAEHLDSNGGFNFNKVKFVPERFFEQQKNGIIEFEDILVVKDGATTGKVSFVDENFPYKKASINEHVFKLSINKKFALPKYIFWHLFGDKGKQQILEDFRGATVGGISRGFVELVKLPLPSLEDQERIVRELDTADALRQKRKQAIALLDNYLKAVFLEMFGDPVMNPKGWKEVPILEVSKKITDGEHLNPQFTNEGMPMVMAGNVLANTVDLSAAKKVNLEKGQLFRKKCNPEKSDILLVSRGATIGRLCRVDTSVPFCLMGSVILIKPNINLLNSEFLTVLLKDPAMYNKLFNSSGSSAQQAIYLKDVKKLICILPPLTLQKQFAAIVKEIECLKQSMLLQSDQLYANFNALMQHTFAQF